MNSETNIEVLQHSQLLIGLNSQQLQCLLNSGEIEIYKDGDIIVKEGEIGDALYVILEGNVLISSPPDPEVAVLSGADTLVAQYEGDFFGEMSILDSEPRSATVSSEGDAKVLKIKRDKLEELFTQDRNLQLVLFINIARILSRRLRTTNIRKKYYIKKYKEEVIALEESKKEEQILVEQAKQLAKVNQELKREIKQRKQAEKKIKELAIRDSLTNLFNHGEFYRQLEIEIQRAKRYEHPLSLLIIDLDNFKKMNDTCGHKFGDEILRIVACTIQKNVRTVDHVARYGGDEIAVIMPEIDKKASEVPARRLRKLISQLKITAPDGKNIKITLTIGISEFPKNGDTGDTLVHYADQALYTGKRSGRNKVCV